MYCIAEEWISNVSNCAAPTYPLSLSVLIQRVMASMIFVAITLLTLKQLSHACECPPTNKTGYSQAYILIVCICNQSINLLVNCGQLRQLQLMLPYYLSNGFANIWFGFHTKRGIFCSTCPGETLHLISLGWFKYCLKQGFL